jgi:small conductance mechanosensitive channel
MPASLPVVASVVIPFLFKLAGAVALWIAGGWCIKFALRILRRGLSSGTLDPTVIGYLINILGAVLRVILVVAILGFFGIQTASFAALLAGAGVAIGAAWSGMLGNFAAGAFMLVLRPFKVGDFVGVAGVVGTVRELGLFATTIVTPALFAYVALALGRGKISLAEYSDELYRLLQLTNDWKPASVVDQLGGVSKVIPKPDLSQSPAPPAS